MDDSPARLVERTARRRAWFLVFVMFFVYASAVFDRQVITILVGPMKRDLHLSDEQVGLLVGFAFVVSYATFGIPLGYLADRTSRKKVLAWGMALWSVMTAVCGLTKGFHGLAIARIGVGIGEAVVAPTGIPMVAGSFPPGKSSLPVSICLVGAAVGSTMAFTVGGVIVNATADLPPIDLPLIGLFRPWQSTFVIAGVMGLVTLVLLWFVHEPPRVGKPRAEPLRMAEVFRYVGQRKLAYATVLIAPALFTMVSWGVIAWMPTALQRRFGLDLREIGIMLGTVAFPSAVIGPLLAGVVGQVAARHRRPELMLLLAALLVAGAGILFALSVLSTSPTVCVILFGLGTIVSATLATVPLIAIQNMTPPDYRSQCTAFQSFCSSTFGLGFGPLIVGTLATRVVGEAHLGIAMIILIVAAVPVSTVMLIAGMRAYAAQVAEIVEAASGDSPAIDI